MLSAKDFRRIVLGLRDAVEGAHMGHPDFRVNGRIFASLNDDETRAMVVLTPEEQERFVRDYAPAFEPESGAWGRAGCTRVPLAAVDEEALGEAATLAFQNAIRKGPVRTRSKAAASRKSSPRARKSSPRPRRGR